MAYSRGHCRRRGNHMGPACGASSWLGFRRLLEVPFSGWPQVGQPRTRAGFRPDRHLRDPFMANALWGLGKDQKTRLQDEGVRERE